MLNDNLILALASPYFAHMGMLDPMKKVFITSKHIESLPILLFTSLSLQVSVKINRFSVWTMTTT
jgi:hypothetical protein